MYLVISTSLNPESRSRILARRMMELLAPAEQVTFVDLRDYTLPFCDAKSCYDCEDVQKLDSMIRSAHGILLACPIYNYDVNAAAKNLVELTGDAWEGKLVGFLLAAGGQGSYMSVMGLANSLMLDFRCLVIPRFVYTTGKQFENGQIADPKLDERLRELAATLTRLGKALGTQSVATDPS